MNFVVHNLSTGTAVEIQSEKILIKSEQDALELMADIDYNYNSRNLIMREKNIAPEFFSLKTGLAGAVLQKFVNYRVKLAIIGNFIKYNSKALQDFISESNKNNHVLFCSDLETALAHFQ